MSSLGQSRFLAWHLDLVFRVWRSRRCAFVLTFPFLNGGYWAKLQAGRPVRRLPLPVRLPGMPENWIVGRQRQAWLATPLSEEDQLAQVIPEAPRFEEPLSAVRDRAAKLVGRISVWSGFVGAHPAIQRLLKEDDKRRAKQQASSFNLPWNDPLFVTPFERRRLRIYSALFTALARADARSWARISDEKLEGGVNQFDQHVALSLQALGAERRGRTQDTQPKSRVVAVRLQIVGPEGTECRMIWEDAPGDPIENHIGQISTEILVVAEIRYREHCHWSHARRLERRAETEARLRRRLEEEERIALERKAAAAQAEIDTLLSQVDRLRRATKIRSYVAAVEAAIRSGATHPDPDSFERWRATALSAADRIDPVLSGEYLASFSPQQQ
jgi:hypothetical protein